jgi:hypothetical protein
VFLQKRAGLEWAGFYLDVTALWQGKPGASGESPDDSIQAIALGDGMDDFLWINVPATSTTVRLSRA